MGKAFPAWHARDIPQKSQQYWVSGVNRPSKRNYAILEMLYDWTVLLIGCQEEFKWSKTKALVILDSRSKSTV